MQQTEARTLATSIHQHFQSDFSRLWWSVLSHSFSQRPTKRCWRCWRCCWWILGPLLRRNVVEIPTRDEQCASARCPNLETVEDGNPKRHLLMASSSTWSSTTKADVFFLIFPFFTTISVFRSIRDFFFTGSDYAKCNVAIKMWRGRS